MNLKINKNIFIIKKMVYNDIEVNIIMDCKISYRKLRIILMDRKLKISTVCKACGMSHNVGCRIMNDESVELKNLAKICLYLNISLDQAVDIQK
jgi:DNA-binding Xre family transcriptional regulator